MSEKNKEEKLHEDPPILGSWKRLYGVVMAIFVVLVLLFYWLTESLS